RPLPAMSKATALPSLDMNAAAVKDGKQQSGVCVPDSSPRIHVGFEGAEKKLEINFQPTVDLRTMPIADLEALLVASRCQCISVVKNAHFDAYLLSESSLFVYPSKIMIKTCGTTSLLDALPVM